MEGLLYVKDTKTNEIHEFRKYIEATLFLNHSYRLQKRMFAESWLIKDRYILSLDLNFDKKKRIKPNEKLNYWIEINGKVTKKHTTIKAISDKYNVPLRTLQLAKDKDRLIQGFLKLYTMKKKPKPDLMKNGELKKNKPANSGVRMLGKETIKQRLNNIK